MPFDSYECRQCGEPFKAFEDANAAQIEYCSPRCEVEGKDL
jgi:predicted nucleic acid-binding Zn ribbon protein